MFDKITLLEAKKRRELRQWLAKNHAAKTDCWVVVRRGRLKDDETFWYVDAVEEALCFGWIDSTTKRLHDGRTAQRLVRRRKTSAWSELNKERCRRLERLGLMTDAGRNVLPDMTDDGFVVDDEIMAALTADSEVWVNFIKFPVLYRRVRIDTIQINKRMRRPELFKKRLAKFLDNTRKGIMYGEWNDNGRLYSCPQTDFVALDEESQD